MKLILPAIYCLVFVTGYSNVTMTVESLKTHLLAVDLKVAEDMTGKPIHDWGDLARAFDDADLSRIQVKLSSGEKFTDVYSFVPSSEGVKFPEGVLICIRYKPTAWPDIWSDGPKDKDPRARPIRYLIYKNIRGEINSEWWYEEKVQAMLAKTGLMIPPPRPYVPSQSTQVVPARSPSSQIVAAKAEPNSPAKPAGHLATPPSVGKSKTPVNSGWWIIGAVLLLVGLTFFLLKRKSKP
jgi:hypothetical protein